ncbi:3-ketoacyl-CoA synthase 12 [Hibiscus syriacus]|uniref:Exocyst subunit Exo70 family protein n=1 Tax=Hibiscus syriacus TaxID=106335 RepID=A0A6A3CWP1_HIBSY|nr:3-ketoacyl-CoA synthase 12 [Hibiscus syriacus]
MEENIEVADFIITKWETNVSSLFSDREEVRQYLGSTKGLQKAMQFLVLHHSSSERLVRAQILMQAAMKRPEEFYQILKSNQANLQPNPFRLTRPQDHPFPIERVSMAAMADLRAIAEAMVSAQLGQKMEWEVLEVKIKTWLSAVKMAVKTLFYGERILCDQVFSISTPRRESCFTEISKGGALALFGFPENVAKCKKTPEKYFETVIQKDSSKTTVPGGGVHPLARYVMNYISFLSDYSLILSYIFADWPFTIPSALPESYFGSPDNEESISSPISVRLAWLVLVMLCKLDSKAAMYKDAALSYLFLANNLQHVIGKVRQSNLNFLLGDDWVIKHEQKVKQLSCELREDRMEQSTCITARASNGRGSNGSDYIKVSLARRIVPIYKEFCEIHGGVEAKKEMWFNQLSDIPLMIWEIPGRICSMEVELQGAFRQVQAEVAVVIEPISFGAVEKIAGHAGIYARGISQDSGPSPRRTKVSLDKWLMGFWSELDDAPTSIDMNNCMNRWGEWEREKEKGGLTGLSSMLAKANGGKHLSVISALTWEIRMKAQHLHACLFSSIPIAGNQVAPALTKDESVGEGDCFWVEEVPDVVLSRVATNPRP